MWVLLCNQYAVVKHRLCTGWLAGMLFDGVKLVLVEFSLFPLLRSRLYHLLPFLFLSPHRWQSWNKFKIVYGFLSLFEKLSLFDPFFNQVTDFPIVRLYLLVNTFLLIPDDLRLFELEYVKRCLLHWVIVYQSEQVWWLAVFYEVYEPYFLLTVVIKRLSHKLVDVLSMIVTHNWEWVFVCKQNSLFFKLISVSKADVSPLWESHGADIRYLMANTEGKVLLFEDLLVFDSKLGW